MSETEYGSLQDIVDTQTLERPADAVIGAAGADRATADGTATVTMPHNGAKPALAGTQDAATETMDPVTAPAVASDAATETMDPIGQPHTAPDAATETIDPVTPASADTPDGTSNAPDAVPEGSAAGSPESSIPGASPVSDASPAPSAPANPAAPPVWTAHGVREATAMPKLAPDPSLPVDGSVPASATVPAASSMGSFRASAAAKPSEADPAANPLHAMPHPPLNAPTSNMGGAQPAPPSGFTAPAVPGTPGAAVPEPEPEPKRPTGVSVPTVLFGLCGILFGVIGILFGWELVMLPSILASLDMQKVVAMVCAGVGVLLIIAGIVWSVSNVVTKRSRNRKDGHGHEDAEGHAVDAAADRTADHAADHASDHAADLASAAAHDAPKVGRKE